MRRFLSLTLIAVCTASGMAIDFTPNFAETIDDGIPMRRMYFTEGAKRIYYRPPATWVATGDALSATFQKRDSASQFSVRNAPPSAASLPLEGRGLEALRKIAATVMPPGATDVFQSWETVNPVVLQGWTSFEAGFEYLQGGRRFCRSVLFINLAAQRQVCFIVDAPPDDFQATHKLAHRTLATWWEP